MKYPFSKITIPQADEAESGKPQMHVRLKRDGLNSDILTSTYGVEFAEVCQSAPVVEVDGLTFRVISKEHLIRNKRTAGRDKD